MHWTFNAATTPSRLNAAAVEAVIRKSYTNVTRVSNDCGRADNVGAHQTYDGHSSRMPDVSRWGYCTRFDGHNVIAFGRLPRGILAVTCSDISGGRIHEADILVNSRYNWAVSVGKCHRQELLEPTVTHEVGHVFGLGHVGERRHPLLTMSTASDGDCNNEASSLGLGDMLALEKLY